MASPFWRSSVWCSNSKPMFLFFNFQTRLLSVVKVVPCSSLKVDLYRDGPPPDFSGIPDFFFTSVKKKTWVRQVDYFFCLGKIGGIIRHYCRPATKYKISRSIRISRFHVWKSQVFVLFRNWKKKKASHFVACLQAHKTWAKNKFYDRLNWRPWLNPLHTATQRVR